MFSIFPQLFRNKTWFLLLLCLLPVVIYILVFNAIALNINYIAFDDITILGVIPKFETASWPQRWKALTELFPEHRLVFSRSVILLLYNIFGEVNLIWAMIVANICWVACAFVFYLAFRKLNISFWYFVPIVWLWFNIQSFENIFWGVSSLCNFGVLLFVISALYRAVYSPQKIAGALSLAILATFTYGNGLMVFPVIGLVCLLTGRIKHLLITIGVAGLVAGIYFMDFKPITQNLSFSDPEEVKQGFFGLFGFLGSIGTISAYGIPPFMLSVAVGTGMIMVAIVVFILSNQWKNYWIAIIQKVPYINKGALFALALAVFTGITALALIYKRIPTDTFEGMFKGRYRMYSTLFCISLYFSFLSLCASSIRRKYFPAILFVSVCLNLVILHGNFASAVNNRRMAIAQEFNARYNADWLGLRMFEMSQGHFEQIRAYYQSEDPLAEGWNPRQSPTELQCDSLYIPDSVEAFGDNIIVSFGNDSFAKEKDYSDGAYVILKSDEHIYAASPDQYAVPLKTTLRRQMYFAKGAFAHFHHATVEPGLYNIYLLHRKNGANRLYCTGKTWKEE